MKDVNMKIKHWLISYFIIILAGLGCIGGMVAWIDPLFHYHRPLDQTFSYVLNNLIHRVLLHGNHNIATRTEAIGHIPASRFIHDM